MLIFNFINKNSPTYLYTRVWEPLAILGSPGVFSAHHFSATKILESFYPKILAAGQRKVFITLALTLNMSLIRGLWEILDIFLMDISYGYFVTWLLWKLREGVQANNMNLRQRWHLTWTLRKYKPISRRLSLLFRDYLNDHGF